MYKTMHEKANSKTPPRGRTPSKPTTPQTQPPTTRSSTPAKPSNAPPNTKPTPKLDKTFFDLLTDVTAELIVESAKLDRLGRYLTKNPKNQK